MNNQKALENWLLAGWAASFVSTLGSLYFSEIVGFEPCQLCWYQRILMYPQVILLGLAAARKDYSIALYSLVLSCIGAAFSIYHYGLQKVPFLGDHAAVCGRVPCTGEYINWLGFITIPFLALSGFAIIIVSSIMILKIRKAGR
ncbi:disulfide bond formation protein B [Bacillus mangrovi]|uniref:Probable disulfide formation protein n=1 Tax=Metabacillus mangrovi TaxID=1491830 RepID=A0A7X2S4W0_9BACI|nr:disulfide oxidoreductase [Metabacillus mangrovi]MTH53452.1 disulfide bond formation protein B [Metabacillus mangrovi]